MAASVAIPESDTSESLSEWVPLLPDGAVSVEVEENSLVLRASQSLQERFEELLELRKSDRMTVEEARQYAAICDLDHALSWLNRLARDTARR